MPLFYGRKKEKRRVLKSLEKYTVCAQILSTESRRCFKLILAINVVTRSLGGCFSLLSFSVYMRLCTRLCVRARSFRPKRRVNSQCVYKCFYEEQMSRFA